MISHNFNYKYKIKVVVFIKYSSHKCILSDYFLYNNIILPTIQMGIKKRLPLLRKGISLFEFIKNILCTKITNIRLCKKLK
jgi:hypothetical protein